MGRTKLITFSFGVISAPPGVAIFTRLGGSGLSFPNSTASSLFYQMGEADYISLGSLLFWNGMNINQGKLIFTLAIAKNNPIFSASTLFLLSRWCRSPSSEALEPLRSLGSLPLGERLLPCLCHSLCIETPRGSSTGTQINFPISPSLASQVAQW